MPLFHSHLWPGVPFAVGSAVLFGLSTPLAKLLLGSIDPWLMAGLLYIGAGAGLAAVRFLRPRATRAAGPSIRGQDLPWLLAVVATGGIAGPVLLMLGLASLEASSASLLLNLEGLATLAIAWIVFRENVDLRLFVGAMAILAGAAVLSWSGESLAFNVSSLLVAAACVAWGIDNNLTRKLSFGDPVQITMIKGLAAGTVNLCIAAARGASFPGAADVVAASVVGFFGYGVSLVLFVLALRHLGAARTGAYFALAPFIGAALAIAILAEPLTVRLLIAGILMGAGLWLHLAERHEHEHTHEALAHEHAHVHDAHHQHQHRPSDPWGEPHVHAHVHAPLVHRHPHYPDLHHRHQH